MDEYVYERVKKLIQEHPEYKNLLKRIIEVENNPREDIIRTIGWQWYHVRALPAQLMKLVREGIVDVTYKSSKYTHYKLRDKKAVELASKYKKFYATIGLHPIHLFSNNIDEEKTSFISHEDDFINDDFQNLIKNCQKIIGIGECGLDFYHLPKNKEFSVVLNKQIDIFKKQCKFALKNNSPLVIHVRNSDESIFPNAYK